MVRIRSASNARLSANERAMLTRVNTAPILGFAPASHQAEGDAADDAAMLLCLVMYEASAWTERSIRSAPADRASALFR